MKKAETLRSSVRRELGLARPAGRALRVLALAGLCWSLSTAAQPPYRQEILPGVSSLDIEGGVARPRMADLDGDGDLDLLAGGWTGTFQLFANVTAAERLDFVGVPASASPFGALTVFTHASPILADVDADGDLDLLSSRANAGGLVYFKNTGSAAAPAFAQQTSSHPFAALADTSRGGDLGDLDGDGDLDLLVTSTTNVFSYFENTGSAAAAAFVQRTGSGNPFPAVAGAHGPEFADLDGDGDLDLVIGLMNGGGLAYLRNTGTSAAPAFVAVTGSASPFAAFTSNALVLPELVDLDQDGDLDAVLGNLWGGFDLLYNTGSRSAPAFAPAGAADPLVGLDAGNILIPDFVDLDGDGDRDLVAVVDGDLARFFINTGSDARPAFVAVTGSADPFAAIGDLGNAPILDLADIDGDGDLDALSGSYFGIDFGSPTFLRNVGSPAAPSFVRGATGEIFGSAAYWQYTRTNPEFGDLDGDGDYDLAIGMTPPFRTKYFENTGSAAAPSLVERTGAANPVADLLHFHNYPEILDYDGDGDADVVYTARGGVRMGLLENTGAPGVPAFVERSTAADNPFWDVQSGIGGLIDIDGDGDLDFLLGADGGRLVFYRSGAVLFYDGFESGDLTGWDGASL